jgi:hypothetical protein
LHSGEHEEYKANSGSDLDKRDTEKCHNKKVMKGWMHEMDGEPAWIKAK